MNNKSSVNRTCRFLLLFICFLLGSCYQNPSINIVSSDSESKLVVAKLSACINSSLANTRVVNSEWEKEDVIGVCMNLCGSDVTADGVFNHCYYAVSFGTVVQFQPFGKTPFAHFPADGSRVDFLAYYPYEADKLTKDYLLPVDVSLQPATDLLTAHSGGYDSTTPQVLLDFRHRLTKLIFVLDGNDVVSTDLLVGARLTIMGMNTKAECRLTDGMMVNAREPAGIEVSLNASGTWGEAVVFPREASEGVSYVVTLTDGQTYTAYMDALQVLAPGTCNTFHLTLQLTPITVSAQVDAWEAGGDGDIVIE